MVRFCDMEINSVEYNSISRRELLHYFLNGHLEEIVYIYDEYGYLGYTTCDTVLHSISLDAAIIRDVLVLDESIWAEAKKMFWYHRSHLNKHPLLPVVDREGNLVSFAYEDDDANRELRQIRELGERQNPNMVQFVDMYPDCDCVIIYGFNELAYYFASYLREQGIPVQVEGTMWGGFFESDNVQVPEYRCMKIYAEGTWEKPANWEENLLRTVSVEFEYVDKIYEENIRKGYIKDDAGSCENMLQKLKSNVTVVILGTDTDAQDSYDFLLQNGIGAECFVIWGDNVFERKLFGRSVYSIAEAVAKYGNSMVIMDNHYENSAWGGGETDYFEYLGYRRNEGFILLRDYAKIQGNSLRTALKRQKIVMIGDIFLCERLQEYFMENDIMCPDELKYILLPEEKMPDKSVLNVADVREICPETLFLIIVPEYFEERYKLKCKPIKEDVISVLRKHGLINYTDYFSYVRAFIDIEKETKNKYPDSKWMVKKIVLGSIEPHSGSVLFRQLLDEHPSIMLMYSEYYYVSCQLFWYCICLAGKRKEEIISLFGQWCLIECQHGNFDEKRIAIYMERICKLLENERKYTSQELFVIFHAALSEKSKEIGNMIIYWEPHQTPRELIEKYVLWLGTEDIPCDIVNVIRNTYIRKGSEIKWVFIGDTYGTDYMSLYRVVRPTNIKNEKFEGSKRLVVKFEDLKCKPREELNRICREWEIPWSDTLMKTTMHGKESSVDNGIKMVRDFDLEPVYNQYEEYFSEFDRFKITLICTPWQRKYGYPFVDISLFSRRDLQEMFIKKFRFEDMIDYNKAFEDEKKKVEFLIDIQSYIRRLLQNVWMLNSITSEI